MKAVFIAFSFAEVPQSIVWTWERPANCYCEDFVSKILLPGGATFPREFAIKSAKSVLG
jgi:hypothetical protein